MELAEPSSPVAIRLAGWRTPDRVSHQIGTRRHAQHGTNHPRHHTHQGALNDDELTRRLRDFEPSGAP